MHELIIVAEGGNWFYYPTECDSAKEAFEAFKISMFKAGINDNNVQYIRADLREDVLNNFVIDTYEIE